MLKDYAMIGMGNAYGNPKEDLKQTMHDFEEHMELLYRFTNDPVIKKSIEKSKALWEPVKKTLMEQPEKEKAKMLQPKLETLLKCADELKVWGVDDPKFKQKMDQAMKLFKDSLELLIKYEKNTPEISGLLQKVKRSFMFFEIMNR